MHFSGLIAHWKTKTTHFGGIVFHTSVQSNRTLMVCGGDASEVHNLDSEALLYVECITSCYEHKVSIISVGQAVKILQSSKIQLILCPYPLYSFSDSLRNLCIGLHGKPG